MIAKPSDQEVLLLFIKEISHILQLTIVLTFSYFMLFVSTPCFCRRRDDPDRKSLETRWERTEKEIVQIDPTKRGDYRGRAIIISNGRYEATSKFENFPNYLQESEFWIKVLTALGFEVLAYIDRTAKEMNEIFEHRLREGIDEPRNVFLYYVGHGAFHSQEGQCMIGIDGLAISELIFQDVIEELSCPGFIVMNCCRELMDIEFYGLGSCLSLKCDEPVVQVQKHKCACITWYPVGKGYEVWYTKHDFKLTRFSRHFEQELERIASSGEGHVWDLTSVFSDLVHKTGDTNCQRMNLKSIQLLVSLDKKFINRVRKLNQ